MNAVWSHSAALSVEVPKALVFAYLVVIIFKEELKCTKIWPGEISDIQYPLMPGPY